MVVEIPERLLPELTKESLMRGVTVDSLILGAIESALNCPTRSSQSKPLKSGYGLLKSYGCAPSAAEIDENREDMFQNFGANL